MVAKRQKSGKTPRTYGDYREMLKEKDLDIVLVGTPDHWHALPMIAAVEAGADVYVQKPISLDVLEGEAMVAAARKHDRVVQVGTQRKSTPHLIDAKKNVVDAGLLGKIGHVEICCYFHMRANGNPPVTDAAGLPRLRDVDRARPLRPYDGLPHKRWWRTFMEYGNGIMGDMCVHMFDTVRWMLGLGWPTKISSTGGILVQKEGKSNIADTQVATFEYADLNVVWQHRTWGDARRPRVPVGAVHLRREGHAQGQHHALRLRPAGRGRSRSTRTASSNASSTPRTSTEPDIELQRRAGDRRLTCWTSWPRSRAEASRSPTSRKATSPPPAASWRTSR